MQGIRTRLPAATRGWAFIASVVVAGCSSFSASEGADVTRLSVPGGWVGDCQTNDAWIAPGEKYVIIATAGGRPGFPRVAVFDGELHLLKSREGWPGDIALADDGQRVLSVNLLDLQCLSLPHLDVESTYSTRGPDFHSPESGPLLLNVRRLLSRGAGKGWLAVNFSGRDGVLEVLDDGALTPGRTGTFGPGHLTAAGIDRATGRVALLLAPNVLELFDPQEMRTVSRTDLPCKEVRHDLPVADGLAFVPTGEGEILIVDLSGPTVVSRIPVGGQDASVALSDSGQYLAAATRTEARIVSGHGRSTYSVTVFRRSGAALTKLAEVQVELLGALSDVAILERSRTVLLLGHETLAWRW